MHVKGMPLLALVAMFIAVATPASAQWVDYSKEHFSAAQKEGRTILADVTADWCPTCRAQRPILDELAADEQLKDVMFVKVDYDRNREFFRTFRIPRQSTIVIFDGMREVSRSVAETDRGRLRAFVFDAVAP